MFIKATISLAALALVQVALAQPYCLLTAINKFEHPSDQKTICCAEQSKIKEYLADLCPDDFESDAIKAYEASCQSAGYGSCASSSSSISANSSSTSELKPSSTAPFPIHITSTFYDEECSCTKTTTHSATSILAVNTASASTTGRIVTATKIASAQGSATSPISPVTASSTGSSESANSFKGAAARHSESNTLIFVAALGGLLFI